MALPIFVCDIRLHYKNIVLHRAFWKDSYIDIDGFKKRFDNQNEIMRNNDYLDKYYRLFSEKCPEATVIENRKSFLASGKHMGPGTFSL